MGPSQFNLKIGTLEGPDIQWKIFRFIGNFSTSENFPTHLILLEKFPPSQFDLKIGTLKGHWKNFQLLNKLKRKKKNKNKNKRKKEEKKKIQKSTFYKILKFSL